MKDKIKSLISILLDRSARLDERDDAAMNLCLFENEECLSILLLVASNPNEDPMILDSYGTSIARILVNRRIVPNLTVLDKLSPISRGAAYSYIREEKPDWISQK